MTKRNVRRVAAFVIALAFMVLVIWSLRADPLRVDTEVIQKGVLRVTVDERGQTRARFRYTVASPVTGRVMRTGLDEGDRVTAGEPLVQIAPPPEHLRMAETIKAELAGARARKRESDAVLEEARGLHERANDEARRREDLFARKLISAEERDYYAQIAAAAAARVVSAEAAAAAAAAGVSIAESRLLGIGGDLPQDDILIALPAPVTGRVLRVHEESERVVQVGTPLFELSQGDDLEVVIDMLTEDAVKVSAGNDVVIDGWGGDYSLSGTVRYVEPRAFTKISTLGVEEQRVNVIVDLNDAPPSLGAGYRIEASITVWSDSDILLIPASAIFRRKGIWHAFVVSDDRAQLRKIEIGQIGTEFAEVLSGVRQGDLVIVFPSDLVENGARVLPDS